MGRTLLGMLVEYAFRDELHKIATGLEDLAQEFDETIDEFSGKIRVGGISYEHGDNRKKNLFFGKSFSDVNSYKGKE